jgi:Ca2+-binding RTX toxin-like protein
MSVLTGTPNAETIFGTSSQDKIVGLGGNDYLIGRAGDDILFGDRETALDEITVRVTGDAFDAGAGLFPIFGLYVNGSLAGTQKVTASKKAGEFQDITFLTNAFSNSENNTISVKLLNDKFSNAGGIVKDNNLYYASVSVNGTPLSNAGNTWLRRDGLVWGAGSYAIEWTASPSLAAGGIAGDDTLVGGAGNDTLYGGAGNDKLFGDNPLVTVEVTAAAQLYDTVAKPSPNGAPLVGLFMDGIQIGAAQYVNANNALGETQTLVFQTKNITQGGKLEVRFLNDVAGVFPGDAPLSPGEIPDRNVYIKSVKVSGGSGEKTFLPADADFYRVTDPNYLASGKQEFLPGESLLAWNGGLQFHIGTGSGLFVANGNDILNGGDGNDILTAGRDTGTFSLSGGSVIATGGDILTGGKGADTFQYAGGFGADTVTDFQKGIDKLQLAANMASFALVDALNGVLVDFGGGQGVFLQNITSANLMDDIALVGAA